LRLGSFLVWVVRVSVSYLESPSQTSSSFLTFLSLGSPGNFPLCELKIAQLYLGIAISFSFLFRDFFVLLTHTCFLLLCVRCFFDSAPIGTGFW
jgi:hypothetical protein